MSLEFKSSFPSVVKDLNKDERVQFERVGYFYQDPKDSKKEKLVYNRIITLRDTWAKMGNKST